MKVKSKSEDMSMKVVSFDFGHTNLAMVCAQVDETTYDVEVTYAKMTNLKHMYCSGKNCLFRRDDRRTAHLVHHFVESIDEHLRDADLVIGELQPIIGMVDVEQCMLIYIQQRYSNGNPNFMRLLSPNSMHKFFHMSEDKVERRKEIVTITEYYLTGHRAFDVAEQKDHLGDACGFVLYFAENILPDLLRQDLSRNRFKDFAFNSKCV